MNAMCANQASSRAMLKWLMSPCRGAFNAKISLVTNACLAMLLLACYALRALTWMKDSATTVLLIVTLHRRMGAERMEQRTA